MLIKTIVQDGSGFIQIDCDKDLHNMWAASSYAQKSFFVLRHSFDLRLILILIV